MPCKQTVVTIWTKGTANWVKWRGTAVAERGSTATLHPIHGTRCTRPWIHGAASPYSRWPIASFTLSGFTNPVRLHLVYPCILGLNVSATCKSKVSTRFYQQRHPQPVPPPPFTWSGRNVRPSGWHMQRLIAPSKSYDRTNSHTEHSCSLCQIMVYTQSSASSTFNGGDFPPSHAWEAG